MLLKFVKLPIRGFFTFAWTSTRFCRKACARAESIGVIMVPIRDWIDLECYLVTKHSWKGKYKRILAIGKTGISTYNPDKFDLTNRWPYSDVVAIAPNKSIQNVSKTPFDLSFYVCVCVAKPCTLCLKCCKYISVSFDVFIFLPMLLFFCTRIVEPRVFVNATKRPEIWYH